MLNIFSTVLSEVKWNKKVLLPPLNEKNMDLAGKIKNVLQLLELDNDREKNREAHDQQLLEAFNNLKMELGDVNTMIKTGEADMASKDHYRAILERETGNMTQEKATIKRDYKLLLEKKYLDEGEHARVLQQLEDYSHQEDLHKQELDSLQQHTAEGDLLALHKYAEEDDKTIKSLILEINKKKVEAEEKVKTFHAEWYETLNADMAIDRANELMMELSQRTKQLTAQWEKDIDKLNEWSAQDEGYKRQLFSTKLTIQEEKSKIQELDHLEKSHNSKEKSIMNSLRKVTECIARLEDDVRERDAEAITRKTENNVQCKNVAAAKLELGFLRATIDEMKRESCVCSVKIEEAVEENLTIGEQLKALSQTTLSKDEKLAGLDQLQAQQELAIAKLEHTIEELMESVNVQRKSLEAKTNEEKTCTLQTNRNEATIAELDSAIVNTENKIMVQDSDAYRVRVEKAFVQQNLAMMQGRKDESQSLEYLKSIAELASEVEELKKLAAVHKKETSAAEDENCYLARQNEALMTGKRHWSEKVDELDLVTDVNKKALERVLKAKCDATAHVRVLRTKERWMTELFLNNADEKFSFESTKLELEKLMKVREDEIGRFMEMMRAQLKLSEQERQTYAMENVQKQEMVNKMKAQFEMNFLLMAEEENSRAYDVVQAAQEKGELVCTSNFLDTQIDLQDNDAKEDALLMFKGSNTQFYNTHANIKRQVQGRGGSQGSGEESDGSRDAEDFAEMVERKNAEISELRAEVEDLETSCTGLLEMEACVDQETEVKRSLLSKSAKEFAVQKEKCDRVSRLITRGVKDAGATKLKALQHFTQAAASTLSRL